jgi:hypothetical protein
MAARRLIGMAIFPRLTRLDITGPYEVPARLPETPAALRGRLATLNEQRRDAVRRAGRKPGIEQDYRTGFMTSGFTEP